MRTLRLDAERHRVRFGAAERVLGWLPPLLDAYALLDAAMQEAARRAVAKNLAGIACGKGCEACCHQPIPVTPPEILGISWYAHARLRGEERTLTALALARLDGRAAGGGMDAGACPFLVAGACVIYPLRPLACREFLVTGRACEPDEDPMSTRPDDVVRLLPAAQRAVFTLMLPLVGVRGREAMREGLRRRTMFALARPMRAMDWTVLARRMRD